jgi:hypothetical protein
MVLSSRLPPRGDKRTNDRPRKRGRHSASLLAGAQRQYKKEATFPFRVMYVRPAQGHPDMLAEGRDDFLSRSPIDRVG